MLVTRMAAPRPQAAPTRAETTVQPEVPEQDAYDGPADGKSHVDPRTQMWLKPLSRAVHRCLYRLDVEGRENLPHEGPIVYCPTHQNAADPALIGMLTHRDLRFMAAREQFKPGVQGWFMTQMGAFPVDREKPSMTTLKHSVEILKNGKGLVIFPEGGIPGDGQDGKVGPLKDGPGWIAIRGKAEAVIPITMHLQADDRPRLLEGAAGLLATAGVVAGGVAASLGYGGPVLRAVAGILTGAATGAYLCGKEAAEPVENEWWNHYPKTQAAVLGGLKGAAAGALAGLTWSFVPGVAGTAMGVVSSLGAGLATHAAATGWRNRDVARIVIGDPLKVDEYVQKYGKKAADEELMKDLATELGRTRAKLVGVPYQPPPPAE